MTCPLGQSFPLQVPCAHPPALYTRIFACTLEELPRPPRLVFFFFQIPPPQCLEPKRNECMTRSHHFGHRRSAATIAWSPSVTLRPAPAPQSRSAFSTAPSPLVCPPTHPFKKKPWPHPLRLARAKGPLLIGLFFLVAPQGIPIQDIPSNLRDGFRCYMGINSIVNATNPLDNDDCEAAPFDVNVYRAVPFPGPPCFLLPLSSRAPRPCFRFLPPATVPLSSPAVPRPCLFASFHCSIFLQPFLLAWTPRKALA